MAAILASNSPSMTAWVEPAGPAVMAIVTANTKATGWYLPVGVGLKLNEFELISTLSVAFWGPLNSLDQDQQVIEFEGSVGPVFHPIVSDSPSWLDGFFVEPKIVIDVGLRPVVGGAFGCAQLGVDVGYQLRLGYFFAALVSGAGLGFGVMPTPIAGVLGLSALPATPRLVWSATVSFVRLGVAF